MNPPTALFHWSVTRDGNFLFPSGRSVNDIYEVVAVIASVDHQTSFVFLSAQICGNSKDCSLLSIVSRVVHRNACPAGSSLVYGMGPHES